MLALPGPGGGSRWDQGYLSEDDPLGIPPEQIGCIGTTVPLGSTELLQHDPFPLLPSTEVPQSNLFPNMLFLLH